jgi:hypothetical protein
MRAYEVIARLDDERAGAGIPGIERRGARVRVLAESGPGEALEALLAAGARGIEVREYPDREAREAWSDWQREGEPGGFRREESVVGGKPRALAPLFAAAMISLALERMGVLHPIAAAVLFVLLAGLVAMTEARRARLRILFVRYVREAQDA